MHRISLSALLPAVLVENIDKACAYVYTRVTQDGLARVRGGAQIQVKLTILIYVACITVAIK